MAAKFLPNLGWVGAKNRDRNYKPDISIVQNSREGTEACFILDSVTKYSEGVNEYGVGILNAATSVKNDESEAASARRYDKSQKKRVGDYRAPDGIKLRHALRYKTPKEAADYLASVEFKGHTLVFNMDECWILEGGSNKEDFELNQKMAQDNPKHEWDKMRYDYTLKEVSKDNYIVRTNHGHFLPWTGYQKDSSDDKQIKSRLSSVTRHDVAIKNLKSASTPEEMLEALSDTSNKDPQLNPIRRFDYQNRTKLKTTGQICLVPKQNLLIYRPVWCSTSINNFMAINSEKTKTYFELKPFRLTEDIVTSFDDFMFKKFCI